MINKNSIIVFDATIEDTNPSDADPFDPHQALLEWQPGIAGDEPLVLLQDGDFIPGLSNPSDPSTALAGIFFNSLDTESDTFKDRAERRQLSWGGRAVGERGECGAADAVGGSTGAVDDSGVFTADLCGAFVAASGSGEGGLKRHEVVVRLSIWHLKGRWARRPDIGLCL